MNEWVVRLLLSAGAISAGAANLQTYVKSLPPAPDQSQIACRDGKWEKQNLEKASGSTVHKKLAPFVTQLIGDAQKDSVNIGITVAYRTCEYQLQLRGKNCGFGEFNLYQKPSNLCNPATEPPGKSLHNEGLAIDFLCINYSLFENSPCYSWMQQHANKYHLYNLATESWHWSTTGQ